MNVLLTGATGFLGSHLARALLSEGYKIIALKRRTSDLWRVKDIASQIEFHDLEELDLMVPFEKYGQIDTVIHNATCYGRRGETVSEIFEANVAFPLRLLKAAKFYNTDNFLNTDTILSAHLNHYSLSKRQFAEWGSMLCGEGYTRFVNVRLEHMYGLGDDLTKFTSWIMKQCHDEVPKIDLTLGEQHRDFIHVNDVVTAFQALLNNIKFLEKGFFEIGVGSGITVTIREFTEIVHGLFGSKSELRFGALPYREGEIMYSVADIATLKRLGWHPRVPLKKGIAETISAMQLHSAKI